MTAQDDLVHQQIDQYFIQERLAAGGMAVVYRALDVDLQRTVALKVILPSLLQQEEYRARFQREARTIAQLDRRHITKVYSVGQTPGGQPYLAMEYIDGGTLEDLVDRLTPVQTLSLIRQVAAALGTAHQDGIVHRDLKPSNILLRQNGEPVLADFGIVAVTDATRKLTQTGQMPGTRGYMAPEQLFGEHVDGRTDIYALGVILYQLFTGQLPAGRHPRPLIRLRPDLTPETYNIVETCLQQDPADRYANTDALITAIDQALLTERNEKTFAHTPSPFHRIINRQNRWLLASLALVAVLLFASLIAIFGNNEEPPTTAVSLSPTAAIAAVQSTSMPTSNPTSEPTAVFTAIAVTQLPTLTAVPPSPTATNTATPTSTVTPSPTITPLPTFTPEPVTAYQPLPLDAITNADLDFQFPPTGAVMFADLPFQLNGRAFKSQAAPPPNDTYPTTLRVPMAIPRANRLHLLLNSGNGRQEFSGQTIGRISAICDDETHLLADLQLGYNVREWHTTGNVVATAPQTRQVWQGVIRGNVLGHIDLLSLELPPACQSGILTGVEIVDQSTETVGALDPALNLVGLTVEQLP